MNEKRKVKQTFWGRVWKVLNHRMDGPPPKKSTSSGLVICHDCKKEISPNAATCPQCGAPGPAASSQLSGGGPVMKFLGSLATLATIAFIAWQFNLLGLVGLGHLKPLPNIEIGKEISLLGVTFKDWQWDGPLAIKGKITAGNISPIAGNSIPCVLYGKDDVKQDTILVLFPAVNPGQTAECRIMGDLNGVERIFIGMIDQKQFPGAFPQDFDN